ncbi:hypothetical protein Leryth_019288 [Lithospermum erythrorhizon]|nr:hypothetical protein Leryth_019288 [Lithospermum erythrorhizon]
MRKIIQASNSYLLTCCRKVKSAIKASAKEYGSSGSGPLEPNSKPQRCHPFEDIAETDGVDSVEEARLSPAEMTRTIVEVNCKATLMFSGLLSDEVHENVFWPDLPYVTDEYGNIYFQVKNEEDILKALTTDENVVQVIVGLDTAEMLSEMEAFDQAEIDFGIDNFDEEDSDSDEEDDEDEDDDENTCIQNWVAVLEDEGEGSDGSVGDWAKLDTMRSSHPMYFAKKISEIVEDDPIDFMDEPPAGIVVQGLLSAAFGEEQAVIQKQMSDRESTSAEENRIIDIKGKKHDNNIQINGQEQENKTGRDSPSRAEELEKDENQGNGTSFYKLEMIKLQLISTQGNQTSVEMEDFRRARPDAIAHSAAKIISRLKAGGEKTTQALRSLCWRCKGIQVEEVALAGIDSLGFDLRVCSGTQLQTLRFAFKKRASSEYSAESQLNDILFPRTHHKLQQKKEAHPTDL